MRPRLRTATSWPPASNASTVCLPTNTEPPSTRDFMREEFVPSQQRVRTTVAGCARSLTSVRVRPRHSATSTEGGTPWGSTARWRSSPAAREASAAASPRRFLADGASVIVNGRSADKGKQALDEMGAGDRAALRRRRRQGPRRGRSRSSTPRSSALRPVDILVNNAGGSTGFGLVHELTDEAWSEAADWILNSTFWATRRPCDTWWTPAAGPDHQHLVGRGQAGQQGRRSATTSSSSTP